MAEILLETRDAVRYRVAIHNIVRYHGNSMVSAHIDEHGIKLVGTDHFIKRVKSKLIDRGFWYENQPSTTDRQIRERVSAVSSATHRAATTLKEQSGVLQTVDWTAVTDDQLAGLRHSAIRAATHARALLDKVHEQEQHRVEVKP